MNWYQETYAHWRTDPEGFWAEAATAVDWIAPPSKMLDAGNAPLYRWFSDGRLNTCYNLLDRHVAAGRGDQAALIYDSPVTGTARRFTYAEMLDRVAQLAGALERQGVAQGDVVLIYMPMVPEAVFAMLACARIGAVHTVVFGGFAAAELAKRIDDSRPKLIFAASCGIEPGRVVAYQPILHQALEIAAHAPESTVMLQRDQYAAEPAAGEIDWQAFIDGAEPAGCVPLSATDPLYILYTSGTTGQPKGVVRDGGGHLVALLWSMRNLYRAEPGDVYWAASDIGWVVGHSYIVYGPLAQGCTTILYEGKPVGTPDAGAFWRVIEQYHVKTLFVAPTAFRAIRKEDPEAQYLSRYDISSLQTLFLAGERADPDTVAWAEQKVQVPVIDHWWQTELGWPAVANFAGDRLLPIKHGSAGVPVPGYDIQVLSPESQPVAAGDTGDIALKLPLPPGCLPTLWHNEDGYRQSYLALHSGYYATGDAGFMDTDGYLHFMSRTDDIINVAGHRLSTGGMEEVVANHPAVAECAVVGVDDPVKGMVPMAFVVLVDGVSGADWGGVSAKIVQAVRDEIGPVAALKQVLQVQRLPKTRSGKILRRSLRSMANGEIVETPATIDDPAILQEIEQRLASSPDR